MSARLAERTGCEFHDVNDPEALTLGRLESLSPRYVFFPHWSRKIPADIYTRYECVVFHMTDVPFGRGGSPLQNLILSGATATKLTALKCVEEMDAGPVYLKRDLSLEGSATQIFARCVPLIEDMIAEMIQREPEPVPQVGEPTHFARRRPEQSDLSGLEDVGRVHDHIRMLDADGYPHAFLETEDLRLEFTDAALDGEAVSATVRITRRSDSES